MSVPGLKALRQLGLRLKSRFVNGALILGYHRVAEVPDDPYDMAVTPRHFAEQMGALCRLASPIRLTELADCLHDGNLPARAVCVTLDDGYADTLYQAKPILEALKIPATVFVATGYLNRLFWWDELKQMLFSPAVSARQLGFVLSWIRMHSGFGSSPKLSAVNEELAARRRLLLWLHARLRLLAADERREMMDRLKQHLGVTPNGGTALAPRAMTSAEVLALASGDLIDTGAHTVTHPVLARMPSECQRAEIYQSKLQLETLLGHPVTSFSYPHGSDSDQTGAIVSEAGFVCACTSKADLVAGSASAFRLPRFWVGDWDGTAFSRWLGQWLRA